MYTVSSTDTVTRTSRVRGYTLEDFLAAHPVSETLKLHEDIPDEVVEANIPLRIKFDKCSSMAHQGWALKVRLSLE